MKYVKTFELFGFGSKSKSWQKKFDDIYKFYLKNKNNDDISPIDMPTADVKEDNISVSQGFDNHIVFYGQTGRNRNWEVVDFSEADYSDPKCTKGVYKITPEIYNEYKKKIQEISDWLDERSDKSFGKSDSSVSDSGELNIDFNEGDIALEEVNHLFKSNSDIIGKEFEFELSYHLWTSNSSNELVIQRNDLKINDVEIGFGGNRYYCQLFTIDPFGEKAGIWLESNSPSEYYDFDKNKWPYDKNARIGMTTIQKPMTRKQQRESDENKKYPYAFQYDISPSKWDSIQMIEQITSFLQRLNDGLK